MAGTSKRSTHIPLTMSTMKPYRNNPKWNWNKVWNPFRNLHPSRNLCIHNNSNNRRESERKSQSSWAQPNWSELNPVVCDINLAINQMPTRLSRQLGAARKKADMRRPSDGMRLLLLGLDVTWAWAPRGCQRYRHNCVGRRRHCQHDRCFKVVLRCWTLWQWQIAGKTF